MVVVIAYMFPKGDESRKRELGRIEISNDGTGSPDIGSYKGNLIAEYTQGRPARVWNFSRKRQSVWSLVGAFLKAWGHTKHGPSYMSKG